MTTLKTGLTETANGQANYLNVNAALAQIDQLLQAAALDRLNTPPGSPANGALYIVTATASGVWAGKENQLAYWLNSVGVWTFVVPLEGWLVHVNDEDAFYKFDGSAWGLFSGGGMANPMTTAGDLIVGGSAGAPTRLPIASTDGYVLTRVAGAVAWAAATGGMSNPMTTAGDIIIGGASGAPTRLAPGTNGHVLTLVSGSPAWQAASGGGFTGGTLTSALNEAPPVSIASAATMNIGAAAANTISVTGTTTVTAFDTIAAGAIRTLEFAAALILTHNATSLILPNNGSNITTAAGDVAVFRSLGSGNWKCTDYTKANGQALAGGGGGLTNWTEAKSTASPNATVPAISFTATSSETDIDAVLAAKGGGATLAQTPNGAAAGGNKRGASATDWQKSRSAAAEVASGTGSTISGGSSNTASVSYSTVGGGISNKATNSYATVGGGNLNTASGTNATVGGGEVNEASGTAATIGGGSANNATSTNTAVAGGASNNATARGAAIAGGESNTASGEYSSINGGLQGTARGSYGAEARASGRFSTAGDAQRERFIQRRATTDATATVLSNDGAAPAAATSIVLPNNSAYGFRGRLIARNAGNGDCSHWEFKGTIRRGANAAATALVSSVTPAVVAQDAGASTWAVSVTADTTNGGLTITVTGVAATNIKWVADVETVEVVG